MKKSALFLFCMLLVFVAVNDVSAKKKHNSRPTAAVPGVVVNPVMDCQDLMDKFSYADTVITRAELTDEMCGRSGCTPYFEHCIVEGLMNQRTSPVDGKDYAIWFQMRLPTEWEGRYYYMAQGGTDGRRSDAVGGLTGSSQTALDKKFAVITSDAGHYQNEEFGLDPQARLDYGYNTVAALTPMAKALIKTYYGKSPGKSYLGGCSNAGRHTMVAASRYADEYDGFYAGDPGFNLPQEAVAQMWGAQLYATISDYDSDTGRPDINTSFSTEDQAVVAKAILDKCDDLDGVIDGMVSDTQGCQEVFNFQTDVPTCPDPEGRPCLTYGQKSVLARIHAGAMLSDGYPLYTNFIWDPGIRSGGWRSWEFGMSISRDPWAVGYIFITPPLASGALDGPLAALDYTLNWNGMGFDVDRDAPKIYATDDTYTESAMSFMTPPDLLMKQLHAKGGKLIVVHGAADAVFSVQSSINWYDALRRHYKKHAKDFARLFIVPGMGHCGGGPACDKFELFDALMDWVENGIAPDQVVSSGSTWAGRTRPLCAYPAVPIYNGAGDIEEASSFSCVDPGRDYDSKKPCEYGRNRWWDRHRK